jgi:magnesium chelatase accessory protein
MVTEDDGWIPIQNLRDVMQTYFKTAEIIELKGGHLFHEGNEELALKLVQDFLSNVEEKNVTIE